MTDQFDDDTDDDQIADALLAFWTVDHADAPHGVNTDDEMDNPEC